VHRHAARIAALTTERVSWEDFKKQQKEAAGIEAAAAADEAEQMLKYRAQLDADRAAKLAKVSSSFGIWCTAAMCDSSCPHLSAVPSTCACCRAQTTHTFVKQLINVRIRSESTQMMGKTVGMARKSDPKRRRSIRIRRRKTVRRSLERQRRTEVLISDDQAAQRLHAAQLYSVPSHRS